MSLPAYRYTPLREPDDIRLVYLHSRGSPEVSGESTDSLQFEDDSHDVWIEIETVKIGSCEYTALSYLWGDPDRRCTVEVRDAGSTPPKTLPVTSSLLVALKALQAPETSGKALWIDAICINQEDRYERSEQVRRMSDIYARAANVLIWLGPSGDDSDLAMEFVTEISVRALDRLAMDPKYGLHWRALALLMRRPWFTRRWIIQEVAFAQKAIVCCGSKLVSWASFAEAVTLFETKIDDINRLFLDLKRTETEHNKWRGWGRVAAPLAIGVVALATVAVAVANRGRVGPVQLKPWMGPATNNWMRNLDIEHRWRDRMDWSSEFPIGRVRGVGAHALVVSLDLIIRERSATRNLERLCTMETLLSYLPTFNATDSRDVVFAVVSLAKDASHFVPDYSKSVRCVCQETIASIVKSTGSLNIICRPWAPVIRDGPTWMTRMSRYPFARKDDGSYTRKDADCLVGHPGHCSYRASGSSQAIVTFSTSGNNGVLAAKGFTLRCGYEILGTAHDGRIPALWTRQICRAIEDLPTDESAAMDIFWRTLVADREGAGLPAPKWMHLACEEMCRETDDTELDTVRQLQLPADDPGSPSSSMKAFLRRVQACTWNRAMIRTSEQSLGLVPQETRVGDRICILYGCDVPVILRQLSMKTWEFVGEAYIYGIMDGEALAQPHEDEVFRLV